MSDKPKPKQIVVELDGAEMMLVVAVALIGVPPPEGMSTETALAELAAGSPELVEDSRRVVAAMMEYWRGKVREGAGARMAEAAGLGGSLQ